MRVMSEPYTTQVQAPGVLRPPSHPAPSFPSTSVLTFPPTVFLGWGGIGGPGVFFCLYHMRIKYVLPPIPQHYSCMSWRQLLLSTDISLQKELPPPAGPHPPLWWAETGIRDNTPSNPDTDGVFQLFFHH